MSQGNMGPGQQGPGAQPGAGRPGQMTAVMRAVAQQTGPKVLRIGVVQGGRVIEERVIKQRGTVTVGQSEKSVFVIPSTAVPAQFKLFELIGNDYHLNFLDGMGGRVALATGISDLGALRGQAKRANVGGANAYQVRLTEEARGKVIIGDTTFLFQFVAPPPPQPRPQLPLAVKGGLASQIDWDLTIIAAFSFLLHFGIIGAMYSDWMDPMVSDDFNIQGLVDLTKNVPPPTIETPADTSTAATTATAAATAAPASKPSGAAGKVNDKQAAALAQQAEQMQMQMLAAFGGNTAVQGALNRSDIPPADLSNAAASGAGVSNASGDLRLGTAGGGTVRPGSAGGGLAGIGVTGGAGGGGAGKEAAVKGPTGDAQIGATTASVPVSDAERVVAGLRARFRSCYNKGLAVDPGMAGSVTIVTKVAPNGEVTAADSSANSGLSADVVTCIQRVVKNAQFTGPGGSGSTINIPVKFVQQH
jgi:hypothetical protein